MPKSKSNYNLIICTSIHKKSQKDEIEYNHQYENDNPQQSFELETFWQH